VIGLVAVLGYIALMCLLGTTDLWVPRLKRLF